MKTLYILRGPPGSGKSTYINEFKKLFVNTPISVLSLDSLFSQNGIYVFDITQLKQNKFVLYNLFVEQIKKGTEVVMLDYMFLAKSEYLPFKTFALENGYQVVIKEFLVDYNTLVDRNSKRKPHRIIPSLKLKHLYDSYEKE